jgi:mono/diheme cytochrome c family protein
VFCHGAPGAEPTPLARGLNPKPPQLFEEEGHYKAPELFWIIKNGIKLSGMPAWGGSHSDDELWAIVAFLQQLPQLSATEYQSMTAEAHDEAGSHENPAARDTSETHSN